MTVNNSRSWNKSLDSGATDGKYKKARPDWEVTDTAGNAKTMAERASLHPFWNYGPVTQDAPAQVNSGR